MIASVSYQQNDALRLLVRRGADLNTPLKAVRRMPALSCTSDASRASPVGVLVCGVPQGGKSALLIAVERGFVRVARFLISAGADARVKNEVRHMMGSCVLSFRSQ